MTDDPPATESSRHDTSTHLKPQTEFMEGLRQDPAVQIKPHSEVIEGSGQDSATQVEPCSETIEGSGHVSSVQSVPKPEAMEGVLRHSDILGSDHLELPDTTGNNANADFALRLLDNLPAEATSANRSGRKTHSEPVVISNEPTAVVKTEGTTIKTEGLPVHPSTSSELDRVPKYFPESDNPTPAEDKLFVPTNPDIARAVPGFLKPKKTRQKSMKTAKELHKRRWNSCSQKLDDSPDSNIQKALRRSQSKKINQKDHKASLGILQSLMNHNAIAEKKNIDHSDKTPEYKATTTKKHLRDLLANCPKTSDQKKNLLEAQALNDAVDRFGTTRTKKLTPINGKWLVKDIKTPLYSHQVIGADFMIARELCPDGLTGGICADGMGLGKTVQTLATMVINRPVKKDTPRRSRTTLLIVPCSMIFQWESEIKKHTPEPTFKRVMIYEAKKGDNITRVTDCDIVITTFAEVARSCPSLDEDILRALKKADRERARGMGGGPKIQASDDDSQAQEDRIRVHEANSGLLHKIEWYRIVVDEAHAIKNHLSRTSLAVRTLKGKFRWCLSGTPVMNNLEELFPYFNFLGDPDSKSLGMFRAKYCNRKKESECNERLDDMLSRVMINRSIKDVFLGRPLIDLPTPHELVLKIDFNPPEQILYRAVEGHLRKIINDKLQEIDLLETAESPEELETPGCKEKSEEPESLEPAQKSKDKESFMLVRLIRLRQMTAHPLLIESEAKKIFNIEKLKALQREILDLGGNDLRLYDHISDWVAEKEKRLKRGLPEHDSDDEEEDTEIEVCPLCDDNFSDPVSVPYCKHSFCRSCIERWATQQISGGYEEPPCPSCREPFDVTRIKVARKPKGTKLHSKSTKSTMGRDATGFVPHTVSFKWLHKLDSGEGTLLQSSKMKALEDHLRVWFKDAPSEKFIIFTQWIPFSTIIGRALQRIGVGFVYFTGDMTILKRQNSIERFETDSKVKIMVATLKTAGVGLNLAFASRVISLDLWWNPCIERQAFGRVYRIGQERETHFVRIVINDSIDARMLAMQEKKMKLVSDIMSPRLSVVDMASLLGHVVKDNGRIRIEADYDGHDPMDILGDDAEDDEDDEEYAGSFIDDDDDGSDYDSELDD